MSEAAAEFVVALSTVLDLATARTIARTLVDERLAACVNVIPGLTSIYRWEGAVHEDGECLLVIKAPRAGVEPLRARLVALHPYELPELVALPVLAGHPPYLDWLRASTNGNT